MLIVLAVIGVVILGIGLFVCTKYGNYLYDNDREWVYWTLNAIGTTILSISLVVLFVIGAIYSNRKVIDNKIALYKNENAEIEQQLSVIVDNYSNYESNTFDKINNKNTDTVAMVTLFPELKSNELVSKQIEVYVSNKSEIKNLESKKLDYKVLAWWLFFGE